MKTLSKKANAFILFLFLVILAVPVSQSHGAYNLNNYTYVPPFIEGVREPTVVLLCDTSGSMDQYAYANMVGSYGGYPAGAEYDPSTAYYGYFDPYAYYRYVKCYDTGGTVAGFFEENSNVWTDSTGETHGYFDGDQDGQDELTVTVANTGVSNYEWCGNFLNYVSMRRMDILKRVLIGGRRAPSNFGDVFDSVPTGYDSGANMHPMDYLVAGDHEYWNAQGTVQCTDTQATLPSGPGASEPNKPTQARYHTPYGDTGVGGGLALTVDTQENTYFPDTYRPMVLEFLNYGDASNRHKMMTLKLPAGEDQPQGIVQQFGWKVQFGLMQFNTDSEGGIVLVSVGDTDHFCSPVSTGCGSVCTGYGLGSDDLGDGFRMAGIIQSTNNLTSDGSTPLGESLATAVAYFQQNSTRPYHGGDYTVSQLADPYFYNMDLDNSCATGATEGQYVVCAKAAVIVVTDGLPQNDTSIPNWVTNYTNGGNGAASELDDVARYAHITDLRPNDASHDGTTYEFSTVDNTLDIYPIFTYGAGGALLQSTARNGGFIDKNNDNRPNTTAEEAAASTQMKEWDFDGDGLPDNYFEASTGDAIYTSLVSALRDLLERAAAGTAAAVVADSQSGVGALYQAIFFPQLTDANGKEVSWIGDLKALWLDEYGNIREDTDSNSGMSLTSDRIITFYFDENNSRTRIKRYTDTDGNGEADSGSEVIVEMDDFAPIWSAGKLLAQRDLSSSPRDITTWVDSNSNNYYDAGEEMSFHVDNDSTLRPYLGQSALAGAQKLINYIRGEEQTGYRSRTIAVDGTDRVWRLGDIVYSTPTVVGKPKERYDVIYGDTSYANFKNANIDRRNVIYIGANDGMLHAFNGGFYNESTDIFSDGTGYTLGQELWAYIPYNLLPHLQGLALEDYIHVSYVDLKPKVVDAKIFSADATHTDGWGTVLVCGMRFGGGTLELSESDVNYDWDGDSTIEAGVNKTFRSAYFAFDITDPLNPELMWEFTDANLGFTTSYPTVVYTDNTNKDWWIAFGSGPTDTNGTSSQLGRTYVVKLASGIGPTGGSPIATNWGGGNVSFMGNPTSVDIDISASQCSGGSCSYTPDVFYIGSSLGTLWRIGCIGGTWAGNQSDFVSLGATKPITAGPSIAEDDNGRLWVYFGTGKLFVDSDQLNTDTQSLVGVKEPLDWSDCDSDSDESETTIYCVGDCLSAVAVSSANLLDTTDYTVFEGGSVDTDDDLSNGTETTFVGVENDIEQSAGDSDYDGWIIEMTGGERCVTKSTVLGGLVTFSTYLPNVADICKHEGESYLNAIYYKTGTASWESVIGTDDSTTITEGGETKEKVKRRTSLGYGVASSPSLHLGKTKGAKVIIQTSTGEIVEIKQENLPAPYKSRPLHWIQPE